jgi:hypothetical protein
MGVFDPRQGQVLVSPVTEFYRGKAIRQDQADKEQMARMRELQIEEAEYESSPERRKTREQLVDEQLAAARLGVKNAELEYGAKTMGFMAKALAPLTSGATEHAVNGDMEGGVQFFNEGLKGALPDMPEEIRGMIEQGAGADKVYDAEEIAQIKLRLSAWGEQQKLGKTPIKFMMDGKEEQGLIDDFGNYYVKRDGQDVLATGRITPWGLGRTAEDVDALTGDKSLNREIVKAEVASRNLVDLVERTTTQIDAIPQSGVGLTGKLSRGLDEVAAELTGIYSLIGGTEVIDGKDVPVGSLLDPNLYSFTGELSNASAAVKSNYITLAYLKARSMEPGGRLAKDDVKLAMDSLGGDWASKGKMKAALNETSWQALNGLKNYYRAVGKIGEFPKDLYEKMDDLKVGAYENRVPIGEVVDGYRYVGGDPADPSNWTKVEE